MRVEKTTTGLIIHEPTDDVKRKVLQYFSLTNPIREYFIYSGNDTTKKPLFGKEHDVIYISSGFGEINDSKLESLRHPHVIQPPTPKHVELTMNREPRSPLQEDCIKHMIEGNASKLTIELKPGTGKTFIATYATAKLGYKPLIIAPTKGLKNQWVEELIGVGIDKHDIATNIFDSPNKKCCVVTISSIENALRDDWEKLMKTVNAASFGIKITDESHLHLKGLLKFDAICNIKHNWYLSATLGRSDESEDRILNRALLDAERFVGNSKYIEYQKEYIHVYLQDIYYHPSSELCSKTFKYGTKGLIKSTYYRMLMLYKDGKPFLRNVIHMAKIVRNIITYDGRILILVPMIDIIEKLLVIMDEDPFFKDFKIAKIDGSIKGFERGDAMEADYILSTTASSGTGVDFKNLAAVINFDQAASPITLEQVSGRLRDRDKPCWYFDITDHVKYARSFENWGRQRRMLLPYMPGVGSEMKKLKDIHC